MEIIISYDRISRGRGGRRREVEEEE